MSKKRVHEIAKEQGLSSKELLDKLHAVGVEAKTASSSVEEGAVLKALGNGSPSAQTPPHRCCERTCAHRHRHRIASQAIINLQVRTGGRPKRCVGARRGEACIT